ncbi:hypothetical protein HNQ91_002848 [Filimonas zeae]|nr:hypothetical protein [Filimonas zeae]MDR6339783.1 hypothetical protein [Filimonas zeae]
MLRYKHASGLFVNAGPQVNLKISQSVENVGIPLNASEIEFALTGGLGYRHTSGFGVEARFVKGVNKQAIRTDTGRPVGFSPNIIQLSLFCLLLFDN